jgi:hypothetical protein
MMDYSKEINALAGETLAISTIVGTVLSRLAGTSSETREAIRLGLDEALSHVENVALALGPRARSEHTLGALKVVETIRDTVFPHQHDPRHGV